MKPRRVVASMSILLPVALVAVACSPAPTPAPEPPQPTAEAQVAGGRCGDGVCDEVEQSNPSLCPQDCAAQPETTVPTEAPTDQPATTTPLPPKPTPEGEAPKPSDKCGDGVCDGPENTENCPQDCAASGEVTRPGDFSDPCTHPNPWRAVVSEDLHVWHNWLDDGGFEGGTTLVEIGEVAGLSPATAERSHAAARSGSWGYALTAGPGEGVSLALKTYTEKGDGIRFSFWARGPEGEVSLLPTVFGTGRGTQYQPEPYFTPDSAFTIGSEWTKVSFETNQKEYEAVLLSLEVGQNESLHIDDVQVSQHMWKMADYPVGESRVVGGIPVPVEPVAPTHFAVLIHIEDPDRLHTSEAYFWEETSRMRELARVLHEHGGFLTIQPEEDWAMASERWHPGLLAELARDYDVVYSTHTHGPHCRDAEGRLRSSSDCNANADTAGWDHEPTDSQNPWVVEYVRNLRDLLEGASGTEVTDHNGNWEFIEVSTLSEIPMLTWSAYKSHYTQGTYDVLINNPWRPTECNADRQIERFLTHDPSTEVVYIPGWGQNVARYLDRLQTRMAPLISQFIRHADPERVNTC